jgi:APA family basic amino acid/polyamine antiporter
VTEGLPRRLGLLRGLALSLGVVVGSGIFVLPAYVAGRLADPGAFLAVWPLGGALALCSAVAYAELATLFPRTGGYVVYLHRIWGGRVALVYGWAALVVLYPSSIAGLARVAARSATGLLGLPAPWIAPLAVGTVVAATFLNLARVRLSTRVQAVQSGAKVLALLLLAAAGLMVGPAADAVPPAATPGGPGWGGWLLALVGVLWCYEGFLEVVVVAGEVRRPDRTLVRVLVGSVLVVTAVYGLYVVALERVLGLGAVAASATVGADLAGAVLGRAGATGVNALVLVATFSAAQALLFSGPRLLVGLADEGLIPTAWGRVDAARGVPVPAVVAVGVAALAYAAVGTFEELVKYFSFATALFSALILVGGLHWRARGRIPRDCRRIPWWPLPPVLAVAAALGGAGWIVVDQPRASLLGLILLAAAVPVAGRVVERVGR